MRTFIAIAALVVAGLDGTAPHGVTAAQAAKPSIDELWQDRDIASLDLKWGNGGPQSAPSPEVTYQFKDIDESGYSTGYEVVDPNGRQWKVKTGRVPR